MAGDHPAASIETKQKRSLLRASLVNPGVVEANELSPQDRRDGCRPGRFVDYSGPGILKPVGTNPVSRRLPSVDPAQPYSMNSHGETTQQHSRRRARCRYPAATTLVIRICGASSTAGPMTLMKSAKCSVAA